MATLAAACGFDLSRWDATKKFLDSHWGTLLRSTMMMLALYGAKSPRYHTAFNDIDLATRN
jgi:hypothetical protein